VASIDTNSVVVLQVALEISLLPRGNIYIMKDHVSYFYNVQFLNILTLS